jgi:GT2 family glycosyltransferase
MSTPELTVICVSYQRYQSIHVLLNSFLCQTLQNWKLVVIHDGPDAKMENLVGEYSHRHPQIQYRQTPQRYNDYGHSLREIGLRDADTEFVMFTNDDNYYAPKFLQYLFEAIKRDDLDFVLCNMIHSHKRPGKTKQDDYHLFQSFPKCKYIDIGNFIVRTRHAQTVGFPDKGYAADGEFVDRLINHFRVENRIRHWKWRLYLWLTQRRKPNAPRLRVGKVERVLFVHN